MKKKGVTMKVHAHQGALQTVFMQRGSDTTIGGKEVFQALMLEAGEGLESNGANDHDADDVSAAQKIQMRAMSADGRRNGTFRTSPSVQDFQSLLMHAIASVNASSTRNYADTTRVDFGGALGSFGSINLKA